MPIIAGVSYCLLCRDLFFVDSTFFGIRVEQKHGREIRDDGNMPYPHATLLTKYWDYGGDNLESTSVPAQYERLDAVNEGGAISA